MRKILIVLDIYRRGSKYDPPWISSVSRSYDTTTLSWRWKYAGTNKVGTNVRSLLFGLPNRLELIGRALWYGRNYDVVVFSMPNPGIVVAFLVRLFRIRYGKIVFISLIDYDKAGIRRMERWLVHWALPQVSAVTVTAEGIRQRLARLHGAYILPRTFVLPDCVWGENYRKDVIPENQEIPYVFAGGASLRDWFTFAKAASLTPEIHYVVIASSRDATIHKISWTSNVRVMLDQPGLEFLHWLSNAAITVLSTLDPNAAVGVLFIGQSFFCGKAIIATESKIACEYVKNGKNGILVPPGDSIALAEKIRWLLSHDVERIHLEHNATLSGEQFKEKTFTEKIRKIIGNV